MELKASVPFRTAPRYPGRLVPKRKDGSSTLLPEIDYDEFN